jgi:AbiU2
VMPALCGYFFGDTMSKNGELYKEWDRWIDVLYNKTANLYIQRHVYYEVREIIRNNPNIQEPTDFFFWASVWYSSSMAVAIRQLADNDKDTISYRKLLEGIKLHPKIISRSRFKQNFKYPKEFLADYDFDRYVGAGREHIDPAVVQQEINDLKIKTGKLTTYVNHRIAHHNKHEFTDIPQYSDLDEAIDFLGELYKRYHLIFRCSSIDDSNFLPPWGYDWKKVFRYPWLDKSES